MGKHTWLEIFTLLMKVKAGFQPDAMHATQATQPRSLRII